MKLDDEYFFKKLEVDVKVNHMMILLALEKEDKDMHIHALESVLFIYMEIIRDLLKYELSLSKEEKRAMIKDLSKHLKMRKKEIAEVLRH